MNYKSIHIVGTNGKGSNSKYINDELIEHNYKVGLFTSPHILKENERIRINNKNISQKKLNFIRNKIINDFPHVNFGWFDLFFLCSLYWFEINNIDVAIFEAGIGAKKDVVNYLNHDYLLITSVSLDHEEILGNSEEKIAYDKSFAIKNNVEIFVSDAIKKNLVNLFINRSILKKCKINIVNTNKKNFETINISLSKNVLNKIFKIKNFKSKFALPKGRVEKIIINNIECYLDVSHNIESIKSSLFYFKSKNIQFDQVVISISEDKNKKIFDIIKKENFLKVFSYENKGRKPLKIDQYDKSFIKIKDLNQFIKGLNEKTLFIGSFYLVFDVLKEVNRNNKI